MERDALSLVARTTHNEIPGRDFMLSAQSAFHYTYIVNNQSWPPLSPPLPSFPLHLSLVIMCIVLLSFFLLFFFFFALDNTDQCIHLGTRPAHHQLAFASGRAPVSFPVI